MLKKYKLKTAKEIDCFLCTKGYTAFDRESMKFILELPLCIHHEEVTKVALAKGERQPGEEG